VNWVELFRNRVHGQALVNSVMNLQDTQKARTFRSSFSRILPRIAKVNYFYSLAAICMAKQGFESRQGLGPARPPIRLVPWSLSRRVEWPWHEGDHSTPFSAEVKNACSYTSTPPIRGVVHS
jgi:hypothetical protein